MTPVAALARAARRAHRADLARRERAAARPPGLRALERRDGAADLHDHRGARYTAGRARARSAGFAARGRCCSPAFVARERHTDEPMLDVRLFANPRFTAASGSVTVAFFSLFGFIFLMTQYFQFIKHYGPLSAGVHLLPVATSVGVASVVGTRLAVRFGTKLVVAAGLVMVAAFYVWVAAVVAPGTGYGTIAAADGPLRRRHGPHERPRDGGDHGRRAAREGRRRLGRQRHHAAARRHARRRGDRQRLRLALLEPADRAPAGAPARGPRARSRTTRSARRSASPAASPPPAMRRSEAASPVPPPARSSTASRSAASSPAASRRSAR